MVIIVDGYYGVGKTTLCKEFVRENKGFVHLEIDKLPRHHIADKDMLCKDISEFVRNNENVVVDFYFKGVYKELLYKLKELNEYILYVFIDTSIEESYEKYVKRSKKVGIPYMDFEKYKLWCDYDEFLLYGFEISFSHPVEFVEFINRFLEKYKKEISDKINKEKINLADAQDIKLFYKYCEEEMGV